jgi:hypothetical protein
MKIMFVSAMPKGSPYLQEASDEINEIDTGIFHGYDVSNSNEFITRYTSFYWSWGRNRYSFR